MLDLPPFPVDDQTLSLVEAAVGGASIDGGRSSIGDLCQLMTEMSGVQNADLAYHPNDIIAALVGEVRRLRASA